MNNTPLNRANQLPAANCVSQYIPISRTTLLSTRGSAQRLGILCLAVIALMCLFPIPALGASFIYLTNNRAHTVSVIDTANSTVVITVPVGRLPEGLAIRPDGAFAYVANSGSNTVSVISTLSNRVVATIPVGANPRTVAMRADGAFAYVANFGSNTVSVINTVSNTLLATVPIGAGMFQIQSLTLTPDGSFAYVLSSVPFNDAGRVSVIDTASNAVVSTIPLAILPGELAITPNGAFAYVAGRSSPFAGRVYVISTVTHSVVNIIESVADALVITPNGAFVYVLSRGSDPGTASVFVIETAGNTVVHQIPLFSGGPAPSDIVVTPDGSHVLVPFINFIKVISTSTNTVVNTASVGGAIRFTPNGDFAFVAPSGSRNETILNIASNTVVATVPSSLGPHSLASTPDIPWGYEDFTNRTLVSKSAFSRLIFPQLFYQLVIVRNNSAQPIPGPITLTINNLENAAFLGDSLRSSAFPGPDNVLGPGEFVTFSLYFYATGQGNITYTERVLSGAP